MKNVCILTKQVKSSKRVGIICAIKVCKKADKYSDSSVQMALENKKFWTEDIMTIIILNLISN